MAEWIILRTFINGETTSSFIRNHWRQFTFLGSTILHSFQQVRLLHSSGPIHKAVFIPGLQHMNLDILITMGFGLTTIGWWLSILPLLLQWMDTQEKLRPPNFMSRTLGLFSIHLAVIFGSSFTMCTKVIYFRNDYKEMLDLFLSLNFTLPIILFSNLTIISLMSVGTL